MCAAKAAVEGISLTAFAALDGCSLTLVRRAVEKGRLVALENGKLDPALAGTGWRKSARVAAAAQAPEAPAHTVHTPRTPRTPVRDVVTSDVEDNLFEAAETFIRRVLRGDYETLGEAERIKENGLALKHMLDGQRKAGNLIPRSAAEAAFFEAARDNRDAWMGWVGRIGIMAAAELQVDARLFTEVMSKLVHQHLTELGEPEFEPGIDTAEG